MDELSAMRVARNDATFREANERIADTAAEYEMTDRIPFICECAEETCRELVQLTLKDYEKVRADSTHFLNVPGHEASAGPHGRVVESHASYVVVEKVGLAGKIVDEVDPRTEA